jgi:aspartyl-tRNA(Asn)/glutamyl-tRNA(Gln) amidotransferase subunit A
MAFSFTGISDYHQQLQNGTTTCSKALAFYFGEIESKKQLNAFVSVFEDSATLRATVLDKALENGLPLLPLFGVVIAIKDVLCYKDHPVSAASDMLKGFTAQYTATAVERLLDAGAIIIGSCNCDEFAMGSANEHSAYGRVKNAVNEDRVSGGSSGGSAVAVQAGLCMISLGSDTGGSVRQPADFCGVWGLKPTYGRISRYGLIAYASSFDCIGVLSHYLPDAAKVLEVMAGHDPMDATSLHLPVPSASQAIRDAAKKYRFAYFESTLSLPGLDPEIKAANLQMMQTLRDEGHTVEAVDFDLLDYIVPTYYVLTTAESSSNLSRYDGIRYGHQVEGNASDLTAFYKANRSNGFGPEVKRRIMLGSFVLSAGYFDAYFTKAQQVRRMLCDQIAMIFNDFDALLMPVSPVPAFTAGDHQKDPVAAYLADIYTVFANLTGIPGLSIPLFHHSTGLPFGMQVMTQKGEDLLLQDIGLVLHQLKRQDAVA